MRWGRGSTDLSQLDVWASYPARPNALSDTRRQHVNVSYCEHTRSKTGRCQCRRVMPGNLSLLWRALHGAGGRGVSETMTTELRWLKVRFGGKMAKKINKEQQPCTEQHTAGVIITAQQSIVYVMLHQRNAQQSSNNNNFFLLFLVLCGVLKRGCRRMDELVLWGLKTERCIIRWLCKGSAVSSYCHTDWMKARSDDIAAASETESLPSGLHMGQRTMAPSAQSQSLYTSLCSALLHTSADAPSSHSLPG